MLWMMLLDLSELACLRRNTSVGTCALLTLLSCSMMLGLYLPLPACVGKPFSL